MTTWHKASNPPPPPPPMQIPELEILYWDGCCVCRTFGTYDHEEKDWYVGGRTLD